MTAKERAKTIAAVGIIFLAVLTSGCQEQVASDPRQQRLLANENRLLKMELENTKKLLADCQSERDELKKGVNEQTINLMGMMLGQATEQADKRLRDENARLKEQNEELRVRVNELEKEVARLKGVGTTCD